MGGDGGPYARNAALAGIVTAMFVFFSRMGLCLVSIGAKLSSLQC
jgi:hypothetical protein